MRVGAERESALAGRAGRPQVRIVGQAGVRLCADGRPWVCARHSMIFAGRTAPILMRQLAGQRLHSPLHDAIFGRELDIVKALIANGAAVDARNGVREAPARARKRTRNSTHCKAFPRADGCGEGRDGRMRVRH